MNANKVRMDDNATFKQIFQFIFGNSQSLPNDTAPNLIANMWNYNATWGPNEGGLRNKHISINLPQLKVGSTYNVEIRKPRLKNPIHQCKIVLQHDGKIQFSDGTQFEGDLPQNTIVNVHEITKKASKVVRFVEKAKKLVGQTIA